MSLSVEPTAWEEDVVKKYLTATSQQKDDPETFNNTHLDIDKIHAEFLPSFQDEFVGQEQFRDELLDASVDEDIRTFILRGETGSGKSQLCQWLDYELQGLGEVPKSEVQDRIPLHVKANETSLEEIVSTLAEPLGIDPEVDQIDGLDPEKIAAAIVSSLQATPGQVLEDVDIQRIVDRGELESILQTNIREYQKGLAANDETEFDPNLISKEDYREIALRLGSESVFHENKDVLRQALRDEIHRHFSHLVGVDDFQSQLREYTQQYVEELGKRPVIICEDVTTFSVLKEQLLDQIIQVESASYDIVLGYTTGFEQDDLPDALGHRGSDDALTYLKDRAEGYLSLSDDGEVYFLDDSLSVDLVETYLDVIKSESSGVVDEAVESAFDDLYPLNRTFVRLAYGRLVEGGSRRRTPRVLLQKVVRRVLLADDPPYEVADKNPNVDDIVQPIDPSAYDNDLQKLVTWYGSIDRRPDAVGDGELLVNATILETFGFDPDVGERVVEWDGAEYVTFRQNTVATSILGSSSDSRPSIPPTEDGSTSPDNDSDTSGVSETTTDPPSPKPEVDTDPGSDEPDKEDKTRLESQLKEFFEWFETGDKYESSNVLRSGAESVLEMWHDPTKLANPNGSTSYPTGIYYTRGKEIPVSVQGADERKGLSTELPFGKNRDLYEQLLKIGMGDDVSLPQDANYEHLRSWATDSTVEFRSQIRDSLEDCLPPELTIEHCILLGKFLLANAELGADDLDRETVFQRPLPEQRSYDAPHETSFDGGSGLTEALQGLQLRRTDVNDLIDGFFLLKQNLVDHDRLEPVRREISEDPEAFVRAAHEIDTEKLDYPSAFNIGTTRKNAKSSSSTRVVAFLDAISDYAIELSLLTDGELEDHFESDVGPVRKWYDEGHTRDDLASQLERLFDCLGTLDQREKERWAKVQKKLQNGEQPLGLEEVGARIDEYADPSTDSPVEGMRLLHEFQESKQEHLIWEVYATFDEIISELGTDVTVDGPNDLEDEVADLPTVTEYESLRQRIHDATESITDDY